MSVLTTKANCCYKCKHRRGIPGDCNSACAKKEAQVVGSQQGIKNGWFCWPFNYDPVWLVSCDSFDPR